MKIKFTNKLNFWQLKLFSQSKKIDSFLLFSQAYEQGVIEDEKKKSS